MKLSRLILSLIWLACTLPAQTNVNTSSQKLVSAGYTAKSAGIVETGMVALKGREITTADSLMCHGDCEILVHNVVLKAEELDFHPDTGEVVARGNVTLKVVPQGATAAQ
jgi:lipopolysaccharide assembly outer membrane protein LptD (OstA)